MLYGTDSVSAACCKAATNADFLSGVFVLGGPNGVSVAALICMVNVFLCGVCANETCFCAGL